MQLSKSEIELVKQNKSQFVSLKFLGDDGALKQIDTSFNNIKEGNLFICSNKVNLKPIDKKNFIDPFRSFPTTSFFCENIASNYSPRKLASTLLSKASESFKPSLTAEISFWISENSALNQNSFSADPIDKYANLRSDIISTLESININTSIHFHGRTSEESVIGVRGENIVDLADNVIIAKFIIANITESYGLNAQFTLLDNKEANISIVLKGTVKEMDKLLNAMQKNIEQLSLFSNKHHIYGFELGEMHSYKTTTPNTVLKISLICSHLFIPYLAFAGLLLYNVDKNFLNKEVLQYFNEST